MTALEIIKHDPQDFGGIQSFPLSREGCAARMCCAMGCPRAGAAQMLVPASKPQEFRVVCPLHYVVSVMLNCAALGDPSLVGEATRVAGGIGLDLAELRDFEPLQICSPNKFVCSNCGGRMQGETIGMYSGVRWVHTCGITLRDKRLDIE